LKKDRRKKGFRRLLAKKSRKRTISHELVGQRKKLSQKKKEKNCRKRTKKKLAKLKKSENVSAPWDARPKWGRKVGRKKEGCL